MIRRPANMSARCQPLRIKQMEYQAANKHLLLKRKNHSTLGDACSHVTLIRPFVVCMHRNRACPKCSGHPRAP